MPRNIAIGETAELSNGQTVEVSYVDHFDGVAYLMPLADNGPDEYILPVELLGDVSEAPF